MNQIFKRWKRTYKYYALTVCVCSLVLYLFALVPSVKAVSETARSANSFVDSIGVNTHLYYDSTIYYQKYNEIIKPKLLELGVHHIRDGGTRNLNGYLDRLKELKQLGISSTLIFDPRGGTPEAGVQLVKDLGNAVEAVEGPNEYDLSGDANWTTTLRTYMQKLYQSAKSDSQTKNLPVLGPSLTSQEAYQAIGDLSSYLDYGVIHNYFSGHHPGIGGWGADGYGSITYALKLARKYAGSKPVITTETGYHNALNTKDGHSPIPKEIAQKYLPRVYLEQFNSGIARTFDYEFIDLFDDPKRDNPGGNFGLLHNNGSPKPAFITLRDSIALLKDSDSKFSPGTLTYNLQGNTTNIHHTLLQKSDGRFYLILWQELSGFDLQTKKIIQVSSQKITLTLNHKFATSNIYSLNNRLKLRQKIANTAKFSVYVADYPVILELVENSQLD
jgi:hypothetical protein